MRKVIISDNVHAKIAELEYYLTHELKLSEEAALKRSARLRNFISTLANPLADYGLCRFTRWRAQGWHCVTSGGWVFAYERFEEGVIVRDMAHGKTLPYAG